MNGRASALTAGLFAFLVLGAATSCTISGDSESREQSYEISEPITALSVDEAVGKITISADNGPVKVKETLRFSNNEPATSHRVTDGTLHLVDNGCGKGSCSVDYDIRIPASAAVTVKTSAGEVTVTGLAGKLDLSASTGRIRGTGLTSQDARLRTSAGSVDVTFSRAPRVVDASATTGQVTLRVPGDAAYAVDAKSDLGSRKVDVAVDPASPHKIRVRVTVGSLSVLKS
ncbi:DUF4097 family beta strand repeat-containing protein [Streptomyces sp. NPDC001774]